jgi:hypothetical protein
MDGRMDGWMDGWMDRERKDSHHEDNLRAMDIIDIERESKIERQIERQCVCVSERELEREGDRVCLSERERKRERDSERESHTEARATQIVTAATRE